MGEGGKAAEEDWLEEQVARLALAVDSTILFDVPRYIRQRLEENISAH